MRLVICADGTWNTSREGSLNQAYATNVLKLASAVRTRDDKGELQVVYYHPGVGSQGGALDHFAGGAFGRGISRNILDLYRFLSNNYTPGDEIFLLGFSRGAYTVRSLAGLIRNSGILRKEHLERTEEAYTLYRDRDSATHPSSQQAKDFRAAFAWPDFNLRFIGVWETVGALGIPELPHYFWAKRLFEFHDVSLSSHVDFAYQALAIDEERKPYQPTLWKKQAHSPQGQVLEQQWFPGIHRDVGGGCLETGLSDGALEWMWQKATAVGLGLNPALRPVPDAQGTLHAVVGLKFKLMGRAPRVLGNTNPLGHESVAQASILRLGQMPEYRPGNLMAFLDRMTY